MPEPPVPPMWMSRREWRHYHRAQRRGRDAARFAARPLEERITIFRRNLAGTGTIILMLAGINFLTTPWFPWFLFPMIGMGGSILHQWSNLWAEGVSWRRIFRREKPAATAEARVAPAAPAALPSADDAAAKLAPPEVLQGPHGAAIRRAVDDRAAILAIVDSLAKPDRELLPDVVPTVNALVDRTASLAQMLHQLDADVSPELMTQLESRIAEVRKEPEGAADRERRLSLLERQYATLRDLTERRTRVAAQLESAGIALQNLRLDLLKLRSSGVQAALGDVTSATVEARALSREIGHVLEAAAEVRRL